MTQHAVINFTTHSASIHIDDLGHINCFKCTPTQSYCDYETFTSQELAQEYIIKPLPSTIYFVDVAESR